MIPQTSGRFVTAALLAFSLFALSACEDKSAKEPALQESAVTVPAQEEMVPAQETASQEEVVPQGETVPQEAAVPQEGTISAQELPPEAQQTLVLIYQNGPFPYAQDNTTFRNREKLLPMQPDGYYREYTVPTPGVKNRGARRIVCGGEKPADPDDCYYTADHYMSFQLILDEDAKLDESARP